MRDRWPLVGREEERARLAGVIAGGGSALITGVAGIGKSRLVSEAASASGRRVMHIVGTRATRSMSFGAFAALVEPGPSDVVIAAGIRRRVLALAPVCLIADDADLLDPLSAAVTHRLGLDGASVLMTVRSGETIGEEVDRLWRADGGARIELSPLSAEETRGLLEARLGGEVDGRAAFVLAGRSGGNPLLLRELVEAAVRSGALALRDGLWVLSGPLPVGEHLAELLPLRLDAQSPGVLRLMELLCVGEELDDATLSRLGVLAEVETAEDQGLVAVEAARVRLGHPLFGDVVARRMGSVRRTRLLLELADAFAAGDGRTRSRAVLCRLDAGVDQTPSELIEAARGARPYGLGLAERFARAAVAAGGDVPATLELADILAHDQRPDDADTVLATLDATSLAPPERLMVAANRAMALAFAPNRPVEALRLLDEALAGAPEPPMLGAIRATALMRDGRVAEGRELGDAIARNPELPPMIRIHAALSAVAGHLWAGRGDEAADLAAVAAPLAEASVAEIPEARESLRLLAAVNRRERGELAASLAEARDGYAAALAEDRDADRQQYAQLVGRSLTLAGQPRAGARLLRESYVGGGLWWRANLPWLVAQLVEALAIGGATDEARRVLAAHGQLPEGRLFQPDLILAEAEVEAVEGAVSAALTRAASAADLAVSAGNRMLALHSWYATVRFGSTAHAGRLIAVAAEMEGRLASSVAAHGTALRDADAPALEAAADALADLGFLVYSAEARAQAVRAYRDGGRSGSAGIAAERLRELLATVEPLATPALVGEPLVTLTPREAEIARLAAAGHADRAIAARLGLSPRTVQTHLARAYAKLGLHSRAELALALRPT